MDNPNDCAAFNEIEDAPIGVRNNVDRAARDPRFQDDLISAVMLASCQGFSG